MAKEKKVYFIVLGIIAFIAYILLAAQPVPPETILVSNWLTSLKTFSDADEANEPAPQTASALIPFMLENRFGYVDMSGNLLLNAEQKKTVSLSPDYWSQYDAAPGELLVHAAGSDREIVLENPQGYPLFIGNRIFLWSKDQSSLTEIDSGGEVLWSCDYEAPLTCIDANGSYVLTGTIDGMIDLLDSKGKPVFPSFNPGVSRIPVILGCRISSDGSKLAVISGIDKQRFLFFERYSNNDYRATFHTFLKGEGFRREVQMAFIENDTRVVFEEETGLGIYDISSRTFITLPIEGRLEALDEEGGNGLFFYITGTGREEKRLSMIKFPAMEMASFPFKSEHIFLARRGRELFLGGGMTLASFTLDRR